MNGSRPLRIYGPVRLGATLIGVAAAALLAAACSSGSSTTTPTSPGTAASASPAGASGSSTEIKTMTGSAGAFLTDGSGRAVYLFMADPMGKSVCTNACVSAWPPVLASGTPTGAGGVNGGSLSLIARSDGGKQVAYDGHALYYFSGDSGAGQVNGQGVDGFGAKWWLVAPTGAQITAAKVTVGGASSPASSHSAGGGWS
jgi:predicted lipoprotein with Yx(FWY)xxD motif